MTATTTRNLFRLTLLFLVFGYEVSFAGTNYFNETCYLNNYPDVRNNWEGSAFQHWLMYGKNEGRNPGCNPNLKLNWPMLYTFNEECYLIRYPDIRTRWAGPAINHWNKFGINEQRIPGCDPNASSAGIQIGVNPNRFAGAVDSLTWNNKEFINIYDHGRQLQSAMQVDGYGECYNPTEAGSSKDDKKQTTSSRLLRWKSGLNSSSIQLQTQMANWTFDEPTGACPRGFSPLATAPLSQHVLNKAIQIGVNGDNQIVKFTLQFVSPESQVHDFIVYEFLTGYLNSEFDQFYKLNSGKLIKITEFIPLIGHGFPAGSYQANSSFPIVQSNASGSHAMGVYFPKSFVNGCSEPFPGYGLYKFNLGGSGPKGNATNKWSVAYKENKSSSCLVKNNDELYRKFEVYLVVGTLRQVHAKLAKLVKTIQ